MKRWMTALIAVMMLTVSSSALAENAPEQKLDDATSVLQQFVNIPENAIPPALLRQAYGIAVIPSVFKIGFIGGVQRGKGVLSVRTDKGKWSNPAFITLTGGSVGFQAGVSSTDIILVFKSRRSVDRIADGQFSLGADASVAAGPVGRSVGASTNLDFNAEVYSYSRSRGLFGGVSIQGARLGVDQDANWLFYDQAGIKARDILGTSSQSSLPKPGQNLVYTLERYMPPSSDQFNYSSDTDGSDQNSGASGQNTSPQPSGDQDSSQSGYGQTQAYGDSDNSGVSVQQNSGAAVGSSDSGYQGAGSENYNADGSAQSGKPDAGAGADKAEAAQNGDYGGGSYGDSAANDSDNPGDSDKNAGNKGDFGY